MQIEINPTYEHLRPLLMHVEQLISIGKPIHEGRNRLYMVEVEGIVLCIKQYGFPSAIRRWIYYYLRASKGLRAWRNSHILRAAGIDTPEPVAFIQKESWRGIERSYYICRYVQGQTLYRWGDCMPEEINKELHAFAHFAARIHEAGLMLCDFTPGNILCTKEGFSLVDTNRMRVGPVSMKAGLKNMAGLWLQPESAEMLTRAYIEARGEKQPDIYIPLMAGYRRLFWRRFTRRHHLKNCIIHHDLDGSRYPYHFNTTIQ